MKVNMGSIIENLKGEPIPKTTQDDSPACAGYCCINALTTEILEHDERTGRTTTITGEEKYKRYKLADKIFKAVDNKEKSGIEAIVELKAEEITQIKTLIAKVFPPIVLGRLYDILEGEKE